MLGRKAEAFHGDDLRPVGARRGDETGHHRLAIQEHGAGSALTLGAAFLCACQAGFLSQQSQQGFFDARS